MIDVNKTYEIGVYSFKNYIHLTDSESKMILSWRNDLESRKWMFNQNIILFDEHIKFIENLKNNFKSLYWLVLKDNEPIGGINLVNIEYNHKTAEIGYFLNPEKQEGGVGLDFVFNSIKFIFVSCEIQKLIGKVLTSNKSAYILNAFLGFKYKRDIQGSSHKYYYCELAKDDFFYNLETKNDIDQFLIFYKEKKCLYQEI